MNHQSILYSLNPEYHQPNIHSNTNVMRRNNNNLSPSQINSIIFNQNTFLVKCFDILKIKFEFIKKNYILFEYLKSNFLQAAGLCKWVINIMKYYEVYCEVEPKRQALNQATQTRQAAEDRLVGIQTKISELEEALSKLTAEYQQATEAKLKCQQEAEATSKTIILANRLVSGLTSENDRWTKQVVNLSPHSINGKIYLT